jgi:methyl-accepting chemotaxis protein
MVAIPFRLSMSAKFVLIGGSFSLPIVLLLYLYTSQVQSQVEFSERELRGTAYLRPLVTLDSLLREPPSPDRDRRATAAWDELEKAQAAHGEVLQFTPAGLQRRSRLGLDPASMRARWNRWQIQPDPAARRSLEADFARMINHTGDLSNLILDPDLDTYYLMDVTLMALPQLQYRLNRIDDEISTPEASTRMAIEAGLLKEVDLARVNTNTHTAWAEDPNFNGSRSSLQPRLEASLTTFIKPQNALILALEAGNTDPTQITGLTVQARRAALAFWRTTVDELDALLLMRIEQLRWGRNWALAISLLSVMGASLLAFVLLRSITRPLELVVSELSPKSVAMRLSAERLSLCRLRAALSDEESAKLSAEMSQHSLTIRRAVIELVAQISGRTSELASRVEGVEWGTSRK